MTILFWFLATHAMASERSDQLAVAFQEFCLKSSPLTVTLSAKASALGGHKIIDRIIPSGHNKNIHQQGWIVGKSRGEFELTAIEDDMAGELDPVLGCGLIELDTDGNTLERSLVSQAGLGIAGRHSVADGMHAATVSWRVKTDVGYEDILLSLNVPVIAGATVNLIFHNQKDVGRRVF